MGKNWKKWKNGKNKKNLEKFGKIRKKLGEIRKIWKIHDFGLKNDINAPSMSQSTSLERYEKLNFHFFGNDLDF